MTSRILFLIVLAAVGLFFGHANPACHLPCLALLTPYALVVLGRGCPVGTAFRRGLLGGWAGYLGVVYWIAPLVHDFGMAPWVLSVPCAMLAALWCALFTGLFAAFAGMVSSWSLPLAGRAVALGLAWYLLEWARGWLLTGVPWVPLSAAFAEWPAAIAPASVVGAYGLSGVLAAAASCWAWGRRGVALGCAALAGTVGLGLWILHLKVPATEPCRIVIVQGNVDQGVKWDAAVVSATIGRYCDLTRRSMERSPKPPALVVWPETAMPFDIERNPGLSERLRTFCGARGIRLLAGAVGWSPRDRRYLNRAYLLDGTGVTDWYEKEHLVPFGEYMPPMLDWPCLRGLTQGVGVFVRGTRTGPIEVAAGNGLRNLVVGVLICYEGIFPELAAARVADGATVLVEISNDAWFGRSSAPMQHLHATALRAVEQGRPLIRVTNTGISSFVDARGRLLGRTPLGAAGAIGVDVAPADASYRTVFHVVGPYLPWAAAMILVTMWRIEVRRRRDESCCKLPI